MTSHPQPQPRRVSTCHGVLPSPLGFFSFMTLFSSARGEKHKNLSLFQRVFFPLPRSRARFQIGQVTRRIKCLCSEVGRGVTRQSPLCRVRIFFKHLLQFAWLSEGITKSSADSRSCKKPGAKSWRRTLVTKNSRRTVSGETGGKKKRGKAFFLSF